MSDLRRAAEFARDLAEQGHDTWSIVRELTHAADEAEYGWTGAKHFGTTAGPIPFSDEELILQAVEGLISSSDKPIKMEDLRKALGDE